MQTFLQCMRGGLELGVLHKPKIFLILLLNIPYQKPNALIIEFSIKNFNHHR